MKHLKIHFDTQFYRPVMFVSVFALILIFISLNFSDVRAQGPGSLDTTFGTGGKVKTPFRVDSAAAHSSAIQSDGKIVTAGTIAPANPDFAVARYNADGSLDSSFGIKGKVIISFTDGVIDEAKAVAIQADGKIVVAGTTLFPGTPSNIDFAIARLNSNGTLDTTFNGTGKVTTDFGIGSSDAAKGVAIDSSNRIIVVGSRQVAGAVDIALARYNSNGTLDSGFGVGGILTFDLSGSGARDFANTVAIQPWDGRIVIVGGIETSPTFPHFAARFLSDGSLDSSFGTGGKAVTTFIGGSANAVALDPTDRSIVSAGYHVAGGRQFFGFVRYTSTGSLDSSFGSGGETTIAVGTIRDRANSLVIQPDGKIVAAGYSERTSGIDFAVARLLRNGSQDLTFGLLGQVTTFIGGQANCSSVNRQTDGRIIAAGWGTLTTARSGIAVVRYDSDGTLDATYGGNGIVLTAFGSTDSAQKTAVQSDGKIVVAGYTDESRFVANRDFALTRYNADGTLDTTFGTAGKVQTDFRNADDAAFGLAIQADGKIVAVGTSALGIKYDFAFARYNPDGSLDTTFDGDGKVEIDFLSDNEFLFDVAIQPDGSLIVVGENAILPTLGNFVVLRVKSNGVLEPTFGTGGIVQTDFGGNDKSLALALQTDGKIIVVGETSVGSIFSTDFAIARYHPNGSLDTTFDTDGKAMASFGSMLDRALAVKIGADGNAVVAGFSQNSATDFDFAVARFKADGSLDTALDTDGKTTFSFSSTEESATGVAIQTDGKIVVAGYVYGSPPNFALARLNYNGSFDTTFDTDGKATTDFGGADFARGVAIQADGKIVMAGTSETNSDMDIALARYNVLTPTAANVSVSGRVLTANGRGIRNARITLTNSTGATRTAITSSFGNYRFDEVEVGQTYVIGVHSKRFRFSDPTQVIKLIDELTDLTFIALPE